MFYSQELLGQIAMVPATHAPPDSEAPTPTARPTPALRLTNMSVDIERLLAECSDAPYGFPHPRWDEIFARLDELPDEDAQTNAFHEFVRLWSSAVGDRIGAQVYESENFDLFSTQDADRGQRLVNFFERVAAQVGSHLEGVFHLGDRPPLIAFAFPTRESYYDYVEHYTPEGSQITTGGMFLSGPARHFIFHLNDDLYFMESIAAHEITHYCLSDLPLPLWVDEGIAVTMEAVIMRQSRLSLDQHRLQQHRRCWNAATIQEFWSGAAFANPRTSELAYELARMAVRTLSPDISAFRDFVELASYEDAGQQAAHRIYGRGLEGLCEQFFGPGRWAPNPPMFTPR